MTGSDSHGSKAQLASGLLFGLAALTLAILSESYPLVAVGGYALLIGTAVVVLYGADSDSVPEDEDSTAADITLALVGITSAVVFPGLVAADGLGYFTWTPLAGGVALSVAALYAVYGVVVLGQWARAKPA
jgi:hypothetical protein